MKTLLLAFLLLIVHASKAQKVDSIYVNLYTDSLKKGTYNYINVDGLYSDGKYLPLDSTDIIFTSSDGKFYGNSLWIDDTVNYSKVRIRVASRSNSKMYREFDMYIKTAEDPTRLPTDEEIIEKIKDDMKKDKDKKKKKKKSED